MERIYPKKFKLKQISFLEAARLNERGEEVFVLWRNEEDGRWDEQTLEEFMEDCLLFVKE